MLNAKDPNIVALAIKPENDFDKLFLNNPVMRKPTSGRKGISQTICKTLFMVLGKTDDRQWTTDDRTFLNIVVYYFRTYSIFKNFIY